MEIIMTNSNGTGFAIGLFCGAAIGAVVGVLFAPKAGTATRRDLARSADGLRLRGMDLYDSGLETAANVSDTVSDLADRAVEFVDDAATRVKSTRGRAKSADM